jgi:hypothetical protein
LYKGKEFQLFTEKFAFEYNLLLLSFAKSLPSYSSQTIHFQTIFGYCPSAELLAFEQRWPYLLNNP